MGQQRVDTSSISFTALYTGQVWATHGLSAPFLRTRKGALLLNSLTPFETASKWLFGGNIRSFLLQRHYLIDHCLHQAIESGSAQVLEIACGLSSRGYRFKQQYPSLHYIDADLPDMAAQKRELMDEQGLLNSHYQVVDINIFEQDGPLSLDYVMAHFDRSKPIVVITEGLVNYFPLEVIQPFWAQLAQQFKMFPAGIYLSDNYPIYAHMRLANGIKVLAGLLGGLAKSRVSFHFNSDVAATDAYMDTGFDQLTIHNPEDYYHLKGMPKSRRSPFVRVLEGKVGG